MIMTRTLLNRFQLFFVGISAFASLCLSAGLARAVDIQEVTTPAGVTYWLVEDDTSDMISMSFLFRGGSVLDPIGKEGLSDLAASTMDEGAGPLPSQAFRRILDDKSITLSFRAGRDTFGGTFLTLNRYRDEAFDLLRLALTEPRFDEEAVERIRSQILIGKSRSQTDPNDRAGKALFKVLFGDHPYGKPGDGTSASVAEITLDDLKAFPASRLAKDRLIIGVVGNINAAMLTPLLDHAFGALPETVGPVPTLAVIDPIQGETVVIDQDVPQSVAILAQPGIDREDPDYYAAYLATHILGGGGFESRLVNEVRVKRGLAYSTYAYMMDLDSAPLIMSGVATRNDAMAESLDVIQREWALMGEQGVTLEELNDAKTYLTGSYALRFTTAGRIARALTGIQFYDFGIDFIDRRNGFIDAVSLEDVNRVANQLFKAEALTTIVVGRPENVEATIDAPDIPG